MSEQERRHHPFGPWAAVATPWGRRALSLTGAQRALVRHAWAYVGSSVLLCVLWRATDTGYFTPVLPILAWGVGVGVHAWVVFSAAGSGPPRRS